MAKSGRDSSRRPDVEIETLYRISQSMAQQHDVHALVTDVLRILDQELHLGGGCLTLRRPDTDIFVIEASRGLTRQEAKRGQYHLGDGITGMVAKSRRPTVVADVSTDPRFLPAHVLALAEPVDPQPRAGQQRDVPQSAVARLRRDRGRQGPRLLAQGALGPFGGPKSKEHVK